MTKRIIIGGHGGQGIKFLSEMFCEMLIEEGYEVSLTLIYDAAIQGGEIYSNIVYSDKKIDNPVIDKADLVLLFSEMKQEFNSDNIILKEFESNTIALGFLIKFFKLDWSRIVSNSKFIDFREDINKGYAM